MKEHLLTLEIRISTKNFGFALARAKEIEASLEKKGYPFQYARLRSEEQVKTLKEAA